MVYITSAFYCTQTHTAQYWFRWSLSCSTTATESYQQGTVPPASTHLHSARDHPGPHLLSLCGTNTTTRHETIRPSPSTWRQAGRPPSPSS